MSDDESQTPKAQRFLRERSRDDPALVNHVVLAELVWSLRSHYEMPRDRIAAVLNGLVQSEAYEFPDRPAVLAALQDYVDGIGGFTDRLIGELNERGGCRATVTFDKRAAKLAPFSAIS
jgi:predicted nucleic-acid-binding protein